MSQELIKALLVEINGDPQKLQAALRAAGVDVDKFAKKAGQANVQAAAGADVLATKQATAARAIASATETIARQGQISAEAAKQLVAQGSNIALTFGRNGAIAGAIGIATVAIISHLQRVREELREVERATRATLDSIAGLDSKALGERGTQLREGGFSPWDVERIWDNAEDPAQRRELLRARGLDKLRRDLTGRERMTTQAAGEGRVLDQRRFSEQKAAIKSVIDEMERELRVVGQLERARKKEEESEDAATAAKKRAVEAAREQQQADKERARELERSAAALGERFEALVVEHLGDATARATKEIDDAITEAQRLVDEGRDVGVNLERLGVLTQMKQEAGTAVRAVAGLGQALREVNDAVADAGHPTEAVFEKLRGAIAAGRAELASMTEGSKDYARVLAEVVKLEERQRDLAPKTSDKDQKTSIVLAMAGIKDASPKSRMADLAREVQQAADGALQLAQNLGAADSNTVRLLRGIGQVAGNLPALADALRGGGGVDIVTAILPIAGALSSILGGNPERDRLLRENNERLAELAEQLGLLGLGISGSDSATGRESAGRVLDEFSRRRRRAEADGSISLSEQMGLSPREIARELGVSFTELERIAAQYGVELDGSVASLVQLQRAIDDAAFKLGEFGADLDSQRSQADAEIALLGITDPLQQARIRMGAFTGRSAALDRVTAGLDLSTAEGRSSARANIAALFALMKAGGDRLSEGDLGGLTGDQLLDALRELVDSLDAIESAAGDATGSTVGVVSGYTGLTAAAGSRIEDYNRALVGYARESQVTRLAILAQLELLVQRAMMPVPVPSTSLLGAGTSVGGFAVTIEMSPGAIQIMVPAGADASRAVPEAIAAAMSEALYRGVQRARIAAGDLSVSRVR